MKFERGRKKNQLIWSFILKAIASQSLVKLCFLNKTRKRKTLRGKYAFAAEKRTRGLAPPLNQRGRARGPLTMGPEGPLVRFDWSPSPSFLCARTVARLRRSPATNGGSSRASAGGDGTARPRRSFRWWLGRRRWQESLAASSAAGKSYGGEVTLVLGWSPTGVG